MYHSMSRDAASVTTSGYLQHRSFSWLASTWTQVRGALLMDLRLENISSSCHAMHIFARGHAKSVQSSGFVVL